MNVLLDLLEIQKILVEDLLNQTEVVSTGLKIHGHIKKFIVQPQIG